MINRNKKFLLIFCLFFLFANFSLVMAKDVMFKPQIEIPGEQINNVDIKPGQEIQIKGGSFIDYMMAIYKWSVGAIAIIAVIMIMVAGFQWMTAAGNASTIGQAKSRISSSLIGLLLVIGAYSILNFINPSLVHLRTLDLGDVDRVDLNISEKTCYDGRINYRWDNYICFAIMHDNYSQGFYPLMDFGIDEDIRKENIEEIQIDLGVNDNYVSQCDASNGFEAVVPNKTVTLSKTQLSSSNPWFGCLHDDSSGNFCETFDTSVKNGGAIIKVKAKFDNDILSGFSFITANKSAGKASAYVSNIKIITNTSCALCCRSSESLIFRSNACRDDETIDENLSDCCKSSCGEALSPTSCNTFSSYCGLHCEWGVIPLEHGYNGGICLDLDEE